MSPVRIFPGALLLSALIATVTVACSDDDSSSSPAQDGGLNCPAPQTACGNECADLQNDRTNCGACGRQCSPGLVCVAGRCEGSCPPGATECSGRCVDVQTDPLNCGACGKACGSGQVCSQGACDVVCGGGLTRCSGTVDYCTNTRTDPANCGTCGKACDPGEFCVSGQCDRMCAEPLTQCGSLCVDTRNDPAHCGDCDSPACPTPANAVAVCAESKCAFVCTSGFADCDGQADNGCETSVTTTASCGACGKACPPAPDHGSMACEGNECVASCDPGFTLVGGECVFQATFPSSAAIVSCPPPAEGPDPVDGGASDDGGDDAGAVDAGEDAGEDPAEPDASEGEDAGEIEVLMDETSGDAGADGGAEVLCSKAGHAIEETFTYPASSSVTSLDLTFDMTDATTGCAASQTLSWDVLVNGSIVGSLSFPGGSGTSPRTVTGSFTFPAIAPIGGQFTVRIQSTVDVCEGGGHWNWLAGGTAVLR